MDDTENRNKQNHLCISGLPESVALLIWFLHLPPEVEDQWPSNVICCMHFNAIRVSILRTARQQPNISQNGFHSASCQICPDTSWHNGSLQPTFLYSPRQGHLLPLGLSFCPSSLTWRSHYLTQVTRGPASIPVGVFLHKTFEQPHLLTCIDLLWGRLGGVGSHLRAHWQCRDAMPTFLETSSTTSG